MRRNTEQDVWKYVDKKDNISECWEWGGSTKSIGYGIFNVKGRKWLAHRLIYKLFYKFNVAGWIIRHHCDNRKCCNPFHLQHGTHQDNVNDRDKRNRRDVKGERHGRTKLTNEQVKQMRNELKGGASTKQMMKSMM